MKKTLIAVALIIFAQTAQSAPSKENVTIVFNVDQKGFVCWFEGDVTPTPPGTAPAIPGCPYLHTHAFQDNVYFYRGQTISVLLVGAKIAEAYSADLKVDTLEEPTIPVYGGLTELPGIQTIEPAEQLVLGQGIKLVAGKPDISRQLYAQLDKASDKDLAAYVKSKITDPADNGDLPQLFSAAVNPVIAKLDQMLAQNGILVTNANAIWRAGAPPTGSLVGPQQAFATLRTNYCLSSAAPANPDTDFDTYLKTAHALQRVLDSEKTLKAQIDASGLNAVVKTLAKLQSAANDSKVQAALNIQLKATAADNSVGLAAFVAAFNSAFPELTRRTEIAGIRVANGKYQSQSGQSNDFLDRVNMFAVSAGSPATSKSLDVLKKNLLYFADNWSTITAAIDRLSDAQEGSDRLATYLARTPGAQPLTPSQFQDQLNDIAVKTIDAADAANCSAQNIPLPARLATPVVDQWYGDKEITVSLKRSSRISLFDISSVTPSAQFTDSEPSPASAPAKTPATPAKGTATDPSSQTQKDTNQSGAPKQQDTKQTSGAPSAAPATKASSDAEVVGEMKFRVHDVYHFQLGLGFSYSGLKDQKFKLVQQTVTTNGTTTTNQFFVYSRNRDYRFLPTVDLLVYPMARDFFPWKPRYAGEKAPSRWSKFSGLAGFSLSSPTTDFFFGGAYLPDFGIGLKAGVHLGFVDQLPKGVTVNTPVTATSTIVTQTLDHSYFVGLEMNAKLFKDIFGVILKK